MLTAAVWWASHAVSPHRVRLACAYRGLRGGARSCMLGGSDRMCAGGRAGWWPGDEWSRRCAYGASVHGGRLAEVYRAQRTPAGCPGAPTTLRAVTDGRG